MSNLATVAAASTVYSPATSNADVLADALGRGVTGRPLPASLRLVEPSTPTLATVAEGIAWIVGGPSPAMR